MTDVRNAWILIGCAFTVALCLGLCSDAYGQVICDPVDPDLCVQPLKLGQQAPFAGQLYTPKLALDQAAKAHDCKEVTEIAVGAAVDPLQLKLDREITLRAIDIRAAGDREDVLKKRVEEAVHASVRLWYEDLRLWYALGIVTGVAATVGALYGASEFIKANQ